MKQNILILLLLFLAIPPLYSGRTKSVIDSFIVGDDRANRVSVDKIGGKGKMHVVAQIDVTTSQGRDPLPDTFYTIVNSGILNDTWTTTIKGTLNDPSTPDNDVVDVTVVTTVTASEAGDELALRDLIVSDLNADTGFKDAFLKALAIKDRPIVHISSTKFSLSGEFYERSTALDVAIVVTGSASVVLDSDKLLSRNKNVSLSRDPSNPHNLGIIGIAGTVKATPQSVNDLFSEKVFNGGGSDLAVDGSITEVVFLINADATKAKIINLMTFAGNSSGVKFNQFLSLNSRLTNGILIEIKSDDIITQFELIDSTDDLLDSWSNVPSDFVLFFAPGADHFNATKDLRGTPFVLKPQGSFTIDDFVKVIIRDDLTGISDMDFRVKGFLQEPN